MAEVDIVKRIEQVLNMEIQDNGHMLGYRMVSTTLLMQALSEIRRLRTQFRVTGDGSKRADDE